MRRLTVTVTTNGSGDATGYTPRTSGKVHSVHYVKPGAASYADGVDFTITADVTGQTIWAESNVNASAVRYPRAPTHTTAGVAATLDGTVAALDKVSLANERVKIVVAQGGAAKVGTFYVLID